MQISVSALKIYFRQSWSHLGKLCQRGSNGMVIVFLLSKFDFKFEFLSHFSNLRMYLQPLKWPKWHVLIYIPSKLHQLPLIYAIKIFDFYWQKTDCDLPLTDGMSFFSFFFVWTMQVYLWQNQLDPWCWILCHCPLNVFYTKLYCFSSDSDMTTITFKMMAISITINTKIMMAITIIHQMDRSKFDGIHRHHPSLYISIWPKNFKYGIFFVKILGI